MYILQRIDVIRLSAIRLQDICDLDVAFENIVSQPHTELEILAKLLDLGHKVGQIHRHSKGTLCA